METVTQIAEAMQSLLTEQADELGRRSGFIQRQRKLSGSSFAQTLVFGWLANPRSSMEELSQSAANVGVRITRQGIDERFTPQAADFLKQLLDASVRGVLRAQRVTTPLLTRFAGVYLMDSTTIKLPEALRGIWEGGEGSALKIALNWELLQGGWEQLVLHAGREHDQHSGLCLTTLPKGALLIRDLGYFKLATYRQLDQKGLYWVSRYKVGTVVFIDGQRVEMLDWLRDQGANAVDVLAEFGVKERLAARLIAHPVPPDILQQRQAQLREWERKKQRSASPQRWALLAWSLYMTNAPSALLATGEVGLIIRTRWQIEKVFFLWKSEGELDAWRTLNPWRILCELYAKLIALLIQHWLMLVADMHDVRRSAIQASRTIRKQAWHLACVLPDLDGLQLVIAHIGQCLRAGCWISSSTTSPPTFQLFYP